MAPIFEYDETTKTSTCILSDGKNTFVGTAICHEDDYDMENKRTGQSIAYQRAKIAYYKHVKNNEILPSLKALKQVYYTMNHSKKFNPKSYENKMLWRRIHSFEFDLDVINDMLAKEKKSLYDYIQEKESFYQKIRKVRKLGRD